LISARESDRAVATVAPASLEGAYFHDGKKLIMIVRDGGVDPLLAEDAGRPASEAQVVLHVSRVSLSSTWKPVIPDGG